MQITLQIKDKVDDFLSLVDCIYLLENQPSLVGSSRRVVKTIIINYLLQNPDSSFAEFADEIDWLVEERKKIPFLKFGN